MTCPAWRSASSSSARCSAHDARRDRVDLVAQPQPHVGRDLVVARARRCAAACRRRRRARSAARSMLRCTSSSVERPLELAGLDLALRSRPRPRSIAARSRRGEDAARGEHARVRERALRCRTSPSRRSKSTDAVKRLTSSSTRLVEAAGPAGLFLFLAQNTVEVPYATMASIGQTAYPDLLPDFRNLGVMARVLVAVNALAAAGVLFAAPHPGGALDHFMSTAAYLEPLLLIELLALAALSPLLARLPYWCRIRCRGRSRARAGGALSHAGGASSRRAAAVARRRARPGGARRRRAARLPEAAREGVLAGARGGAPSGAAGPYPAALPVQQPERRAVADPPRPEARRARPGGPGRPVPRR